MAFRPSTPVSRCMAVIWSPRCRPAGGAGAGVRQSATCGLYAQCGPTSEAAHANVAPGVRMGHAGRHRRRTRVPRRRALATTDRARAPGDGADAAPGAWPSRRDCLDARRRHRPLGARIGRRRRPGQPRRREHRRTSLDGGAEAGAGREPRAGHDQPGAGPAPRGLAAAGGRERVGRGLLRARAATSGSRKTNPQATTSSRRWRRRGKRRRRRWPSSRGWSCCAADSSWVTAARWRRCDCRSHSGSADVSDRAVSGCRGSRSTTGRRWWRT